MIFENLEVAIKLNEEEPPSLCLAFYLIQSIVKDIEKQSGMKFRYTDIGNQNEYTALLGNQLRTILGVYEATSSHIIGNTDKIEKLKNKLTLADESISRIDQQIEELKGLEKQLEDKNSEYKELEEKLKKRKETQAEYQKLCKDADELRAEIESMKNYDIVDKEKEIKSLQAQYDNFDNKVIRKTETIHKLNQQLEELKTQSSGLEEQHKNLSEELEQSEKKNNETSAAIAGLKAKLEDTDREIQSLTAQQKELNVKYEAAKAQKEELEKENAQISDDYREFFENKLRPISDKNEEIKAMVNNQEEAMNSITRENSELQTKYNQMLSETSDLQSEKTKLEKDIQNKSVLIDGLKERKKQLDAESKEAGEKLSGVQNDLDSVFSATENFKKYLIPQAENQLAAAKKEQAEQQDKFNGISRDIKETEAQTEQLRTACDESTNTLKEKRSKLEDLQSVLSSNDIEIESLKKKLVELKGKTSRESLQAIKRQLANEIEEYESLLAERFRLENECKEKSERNEKDRNAIQKLTESKNQYDTDRKKLDKRLEELRFINNEQFKSKAVIINDKLQLVMKIKDSLDKSSKKLRKTLECDTVDFMPSDIEDSINSDLNEIENYLHKLSKDMRSYSDLMFNYMEGN